MNIHKILVPVDFSSCSRAALEAATDMAAKYGASVEAVHVHEPPYAVGHVTVQVPGMGEVAMIDFMHGQAQKLLDEMLADCHAPGVTVTRTLLAGLPEKLIVEHAQEGGHDLIVMGTHGRRGFSRFLMGSVTERVLRLAPAPVLVVRDHYGEDQKA
ncbi:MAG: universal stress protein [Myxococcales bacterium]|nr:universal stress protein [Myxococcales bacterium]MCB9546302.1 universal stress protein [Myxococcales bacterium]